MVSSWDWPNLRLEIIHIWTVADLRKKYYFSDVSLMQVASPWHQQGTERAQSHRKPIRALLDAWKEWPVEVERMSYGVSSVAEITRALLRSPPSMVGTGGLRVCDGEMLKLWILSSNKEQCLRKRVFGMGEVKRLIELIFLRLWVTQNRGLTHVCSIPAQHGPGHETSQQPRYIWCICTLLADTYHYS